MIDVESHAIRTAEVARNLHLLLEAAGIDGPLVLVGMSAGGIYTRRYYVANYHQTHACASVSGEIESFFADLERATSPPRLGDLPVIGSPLAASG